MDLPEALEFLEHAIDQAAEGPRPVNACRAWGNCRDEKQVQRVPGGCSPSAFRATLFAWKAESVASGRFLLCDRPGLFLDSEGKLDEQLQCDFWREAETRDYAGEAAADETRRTLAAARERRKQEGRRSTRQRASTITRSARTKPARLACDQLRALREVLRQSAGGNEQVRTCKAPSNWIPLAARLLDSVTVIESGKPVKQAEPEDNGKAGRLARPLALPGVNTAAQITLSCRGN